MKQLQSLYDQLSKVVYRNCHILETRHKSLKLAHTPGVLN